MIRWLATFFALVLLAGCSQPGARPSAGGGNPGAKRPNIILITAEDLSPRFGAYGDPVANTPNIDRFADEAVTFDRAFTTAGVCAPSRAAIITGAHQISNGLQHMRTSAFGKDMSYGAPYEAVPPPQVKAFPELLRRAGYFTINKGKTDYQFGEPFTVWDLPQSTDWTAAEPASSPFFAMINFEQSHESRSWPPDTDPALHEAVRATAAGNALMDAEKDFPLTDPAQVHVPAYYPDTPAVRANIARFNDNAALMDRKVGQLLAQLKAQGRFQDSIIIFLTDHGDGLPRAKRTIFDSGTRVAFIVRFPDGRGAGTRRSDLVSMIDLAPTILAMAGAPREGFHQGRDLFGSAQAPEAIFASGDRFDEIPQRFRGVREERFHYIRYFGDTPVIPSLRYQNVNPIMREWRRLHAEGKLNALQRSYLEGPAPREMLFDTKADPDETVNLAEDPRYADVRKRLADRLNHWIAAVDDTSLEPELAMVNRMWPGGVQPVTSQVTACRTHEGRITLQSLTLGASIAWGGENGRAALYSAPISPQPALFKAVAIRYGYKPSAPSQIDPAALPPCS